MICGAIFDMDGTLLDSMPFWIHAGERYLRKLGAEPEERLGRTLLSMSMEEGAEYLRRRYLPSRSCGEIVRGINSILADAYASQVPLKDGAREFLLEWKRRGIPVALATATDRGLFAPALRRLSLDGLFDAVLTCSECRTSKSKPDIYFRAAQALGTEAAETIVFEDALVPVRTAAGAGFIVAGVQDAASAADAAEIKRLCQFYIEEFRSFDWSRLEVREKEGGR
ncbi:MAG: HAD family phosphatase [Treponemataceae bacterium]|nr:HAD family phosphatase [Treponemataceae bacterium]